MTFKLGDLIYMRGDTGDRGVVVKILAQPGESWFDIKSYDIYTKYDTYWFKEKKILAVDHPDVMLVRKKNE